MTKAQIAKVGVYKQMGYIVYEERLDSTVLVARYLPRNKVILQQINPDGTTIATKSRHIEDK